MNKSSYSMYKCSGSGDSVPKTGSMNWDPLPLKVIFAPVSPLIYNKFAPPAPIILPLKSNPSGAFSIPTHIFSYKHYSYKDKNVVYIHYICTINIYLQLHKNNTYHRCNSGM